MTDKNIIFVGIIASSNSLNDLSINEGYIAVEHGKIIRKGSLKEFEYVKMNELAGFKVIQLNENEFIMPGFVDCHTHAPQFPNIGLGLDLPLLKWLAKYTFRLEKRYGDIGFAAEVYNQVVQRLLKNGTTTACYFGSLHLDGTLELVNSVKRFHQRALIGKVSMNKENDAAYYNETGKELADAESFVKTVLSYKGELESSNTSYYLLKWRLQTLIFSTSDLIEPVVTPRFAVSCDKKLMDGLSKISNDYRCKIQSHISENLQEIKVVLENNPGCTSYADVYNQSGLLNDRCILAHAIHLEDDEVTLLSNKGVSVAHCPASNTRLKSGLCPVRRLIDAHIDVGLGTDVSAGDSASVLDAVRRTMDVSTSLELQGNNNYAIDWKEAFYLATLGGAKALKLDHKIGNFKIGKEFDALHINVYAKGGQIDKYVSTIDKDSEDYAVDLVQRFIYLGDDRNIMKVYVQGQKVIDNESM